MEDIYSYLHYTANLIARTRFNSKMVLKGGSVLMSKLIECDRKDLWRITRDLDIHCDKREVWIDFYTHIEDILNSNDAGYVYQLVKRRSKEKGLVSSDSIRFILNDHGKVVEFRMDMNLMGNNIITVEYSPILNMTTYDAYTMMADKIAAVSSSKVYRRIKDIYDIVVLSSICSFKYKELTEHIRLKYPGMDLVNMLVPDNYGQLNHAYERFVGIRNKPDFRHLMNYCLVFIEPVYLGYNNGDLAWSIKHVCWEEV